MAEFLELPRARSDSSSSNTSQSTTGRLMLRQRLSQLLTCVEDLSSDDETNEEVSRTLDEAFSLCGRWTNKDSFRWPSEGGGGECCFTAFLYAIYFKLCFLLFSAFLNFFVLICSNVISCNYQRTFFLSHLFLASGLLQT